MKKTLKSMQLQNREISNGPGLVDFAVGPVNFVLTCRMGSEFFRQCKGHKKLSSIIINPAH